MLIIDDFAMGPPAGESWRAFSDRVMGGVSDPRLQPAVIDGRACLRLTGDVRLENNGGFIQMTRDLAPAGQTLDASGFAAVALTVCGNGEAYGCHLRTPATMRPWQSYRAGFRATPEWREVILPFADFLPHRLERPLDTGQLRRIGLVAIGRAFSADLAVARVALLDPAELDAVRQK
ncbi:MAG TPA: CIA30 family protein [Rhodospirillales bacterium]|jgi:hypothetical protein|nr:CIA30 family protein [Rhodospirillales bacterium]